MNDADRRQLNAALHVVKHGLAGRSALVLPLCGVLQGDEVLRVHAIPQVHFQPVHLWCGLGGDFIVTDFRVGNYAQTACAGEFDTETLSTMPLKVDPLWPGLTFSMLVKRRFWPPGSEGFPTRFSGAVTGYEIKRLTGRSSDGPGRVGGSK